ILTGGVQLPLALAELDLIDQYEFVMQPRIAGHGPTLLAGISKYAELKLIDRNELSSGAIALWYEPRR
ncbi:MAG: deaminase, partial [Alphaproteobacteria bacterium]